MIYSLVQPFTRTNLSWGSTRPFLPPVKQLMPSFQALQELLLDGAKRSVGGVKVSYSNDSFCTTV